MRSSALIICSLHAQPLSHQEQLPECWGPFSELPQPPPPHQTHIQHTQHRATRCGSASQLDIVFMVRLCKGREWGVRTLTAIWCRSRPETAAERRAQWDAGHESHSSWLDSGLGSHSTEIQRGCWVESTAKSHSTDPLLNSGTDQINIINDTASPQESRFLTFTF